MAQYVNAAVNPAATTNTTLYTAPAGAGGHLSSTITVVNTGTTSAKFRVARRPLGATLATAHYLAYDQPLTPSGSGDNAWYATIGMALAATDVVTVYADTANVAFNIDVVTNP